MRVKNLKALKEEYVRYEALSYHDQAEIDNKIKKELPDEEVISMIKSNILSEKDEEGILEWFAWFHDEENDPSDDKETWPYKTIAEIPDEDFIKLFEYEIDAKYDMIDTLFEYEEAYFDEYRQAIIEDEYEDEYQEERIKRLPARYAYGAVDFYDPYN